MEVKTVCLLKTEISPMSCDSRNGVNGVDEFFFSAFRMPPEQFDFKVLISALLLYVRWSSINTIVTFVVVRRLS
jgi:hypothetical protein